jgi:hypothetical protein
MRGDLTTCEQLAEQAASAAPEYFALESAYAGVYCVLRVEQGRTVEMLDAARAYVDTMPTIPAWRAGLSVLLAHSGMLDAARKEASLVIEHGGLDHRNEHFLFLAGALAETVSVLDDPALATCVADALAGLEHHWVILGEGFAVWTHVSRSLGVAARARRRLDESEDLLRQSVAEHERAGAQALLARSLYELARTLALTGRRGEVDELLRSASAIAASTGQIGLVAQISAA